MQSFVCRGESLQAYIDRLLAERAANDAAEVNNRRLENERQQRDARVFARDYVNNVLPERIKEAIRTRQKSLVLMKIGNAGNFVEAVASLPRAGALINLLTDAGMLHRLCVDIDNSGNSTVNNELLLRLED